MVIQVCLTHPANTLLSTYCEEPSRRLIYSCSLSAFPVFGVRQVMLLANLTVSEQGCMDLIQASDEKKAGLHMWVQQQNT